MRGMRQAGQGQLWRCGGLCGEVCPVREAHRGPDLRGRRGKAGDCGRAGVLDPAAAPEGLWRSRPRPL